MFPIEFTWISRVKSALDRVSEGLEDVEESGLIESAKGLAKSASKALERYVKGEGKRPPPEGPEPHP